MSSRRDRHKLSRVLVACVREHPWDESPAAVRRLLAEINQEELLASAALHRVAGPVARALRYDERAEVRVLESLRVLEFLAAAQQLRVETDLSHVERALGDVPWIVFKGPVLARHYWTSSIVRQYGDLDVLVNAENLSECVRMLESEGFASIDQDWAEMTQFGAGEVHLSTPSGGILGLHWSLLNSSVERRSFNIQTKSVFDRSRMVGVGAQTVRSLSEADTLIHACVHAAKSGGDRLVWLKDIEQIVLLDRPDWSEISELAKSMHAMLPVLVMLTRCDRTLGLSVAVEEMQEFRGSRIWQMVEASTAKVSPVSQARVGGSISRIFACSLRASGRETTLEMLRRLDDSRRRHSHHRPRAGGGLSGLRAPAPSATSGEKKAYYQFVARQERKQ